LISGRCLTATCSWSCTSFSSWWNCSIQSRIYCSTKRGAVRCTMGCLLWSCWCI
jgi:hypothetical protein